VWCKLGYEHEQYTDIAGLQSALLWATTDSPLLTPNGFAAVNAQRSLRVGVLETLTRMDFLISKVPSMLKTGRWLDPNYVQQLLERANKGEDIDILPTVTVDELDKQDIVFAGKAYLLIAATKKRKRVSNGLYVKFKMGGRQQGHLRNKQLLCIYKEHARPTRTSGNESIK
jgi:hypothetical protein